MPSGNEDWIIQEGCEIGEFWTGETREQTQWRFESTSLVYEQLEPIGKSNRNQYSVVGVLETVDEW